MNLVARHEGSEAPAQSPDTPTSIQRLPPPDRDEAGCVDVLVQSLEGLSWDAVVDRAAPWIVAAREAQHLMPLGMEALLAEYPLDSESGLALMRLSEALLRVPDRSTAAILTADHLRRGFTQLFAREASDTLITPLLRMAAQMMPDPSRSDHKDDTLRARSVVSAATQAVRFLARQFILGQNIELAVQRASAQQRRQGQWRFSYDMLGESARCRADAQRYFASYQLVIAHLGRQAGKGGPRERDGLSIKLSALEPRLEAVQGPHILPGLVAQLVDLCRAAAQARVGLTIDAEESERLELSLDVLEALLAALADEPGLDGWEGLGLAIQAYQTRALEAVDWVIALAQRYGRPLMVRLVKGAYWDAEIKRAQELGLSAYPVFTRKHHSDLSFLACAQRLLAASVGPQAPIFAQLATHNATSIAAVLHLAEALPGAQFELQKLHGMGDALYAEVLAQENVPCRVYAPVGVHRDLLAYLVRRLLENGANSSFVHQMAKPKTPLSALLANPFLAERSTVLPLPVDLYGDLAGQARRNPLGRDLAVAAVQQTFRQAWERTRSASGLTPSAVNDIPGRWTGLETAFSNWSRLPSAQRCACLLRAAELLEARTDGFAAKLVHEAHKTWGDAVAEVREAVDYCRYYALQASRLLSTKELPGPTGESNRLQLHGRGAFLCISPWNFPLAIFAGQLLGALVVGNTVAVKPAEQTPEIAADFITLLEEAGIPAAAIALFHGPGHTLGAALVEQPGVAGVLFTGSTGVGKQIQRRLAAKEGPMVPLVAETGGINAMIVDGTALPEQVVDHVLLSSFRSAGQRCSALRLLFLQDSMADTVLEMLAGAMQLLRIGPPENFATDIGPVIDGCAQQRISDQVARLESDGGILLARSPWPDTPPNTQDIPLVRRLPDSLGRRLHFVAPSLYAVDTNSLLQEEIFGPILQVQRWSGPWEAVIDQINALGYGLTLGIQTRIDSRAQAMIQRARVGNIYVNRGMTGAVVGVQPFGGEGLSGSGPKAGGPHILPRLCREQTVSINTAAAGGNATLLSRNLW